MLKVAPFFLIVIDHDRKQYSIEGPMTNDIPWIEAVMKARPDRDLSCHTPGPGDRKNLQVSAAQSFPDMTEVPSGSIIGF